MTETFTEGIKPMNTEEKIENQENSNLLTQFENFLRPSKI